MTLTTLVMPYYENPKMLAEHYRVLAALPVKLRDLLCVVIVDDGSPRSPAMSAELGLPLQIYRIKKDVRWNQDAARNIGVRHAETNWVLMTDMDHIVPQQTWEEVLLRDWDKDIAYTFQRVSAPDLSPYKSHPNSYFMHRDLFEQNGGYDERFAGYYGSDGDFKERLKLIAKVKEIKAPLIRMPRAVISDASTTFYLRKQPDDFPMVKKIRRERDASRNPVPLRYRFEYERVA